MKNKTYHTVGTILKSNIKIIETGNMGCYEIIRLHIRIHHLKF